MNYVICDIRSAVAVSEMSDSSRKTGILITVHICNTLMGQHDTMLSYVGLATTVEQTSLSTRIYLCWLVGGAMDQKLKQLHCYSLLAACSN